MKKTVYSLVGLVMVLGLVFTSAPGAVNAVPLVEESYYTPAWVFPLDPAASFQAVSVEAAAKNAPAWLQLFSGGINLSQPTKMCYTFRYGQFNWVPKFLQLQNGVWSTLATTMEYLYGEEGSLYACANPSKAGVYALFAYYSGPAKASAPEGSALFTVGSWSMIVNDPILQVFSMSFVNSSWRNFSEIFAYDVNWNGYPNATHLAWGIEMCWLSAADCRAYPDGSISISGMPYPQHYTVPVFTGSNMGGAEDFGGTCRFAPFVELLDAGGNVLERIYYITEYVNYCIS